jgi:hypothetical protein
MRHRLNPLAIPATLLLLSIAATAQAPSSAWFGVPPPGGLSDPHRPILDVSSARPAAAVVPQGEEESHALTGRAIRKDSGDTLDTISTPGLERYLIRHGFNQASVFRPFATRLRIGFGEFV